MGINKRTFLTTMINRGSLPHRQGAVATGDGEHLGQSCDRLSFSSPAHSGGEPCSPERIGLPGGVHAGAADRGRRRTKRFMAQEPSRFAGYSVSTNVSAPDAVKLLTEAVKAGAHGFGEVKFHVEADGPEMRRLYAAAAELDVPVTIHFQEVPHTPTEGVFNTGFKRFDAILKQFPKTTFVGHCDAFWANISADYANDKDYPRTPNVGRALRTDGSPIIPTSSPIYRQAPATTRSPQVYHGHRVPRAPQGQVVLWRRLFLQ